MVGSLIYLLVYLLVLGLVLWLVLFVIQQFPLPEPFGRVAYVVVVIIGVLCLIVLITDFLPPLVGHPLLR